MTYINFYDFKLPVAYSKFNYDTWLEWCIIVGCGIGGCRMPFWNTFSSIPFAAVSPPRKFVIIYTILFWRATVPPNSSMTSFPMMDSIYKCGNGRAVNGGYMNIKTDFDNLGIFLALIAAGTFILVLKLWKLYYLPCHSILCQGLEAGW